MFRCVAAVGLCVLELRFKDKSLGDCDSTLRWLAYHHTVLPPVRAASSGSTLLDMMANHALQRTRRERRGCNSLRPVRRVAELGSLGK